MKPEELSDAELLRQAQAGSEAPIEALAGFLARSSVTWRRGAKP